MSGLRPASAPRGPTEPGPPGEADSTEQAGTDPSRELPDSLFEHPDHLASRQVLGLDLTTVDSEVRYSGNNDSLTYIASIIEMTEDASALDTAGNWGGLGRPLAQPLMRGPHSRPLDKRLVPQEYGATVRVDQSD